MLYRLQHGLWPLCKVSSKDHCLDLPFQEHIHQNDMQSSHKKFQQLCKLWSISNIDIFVATRVQCVLHSSTSEETISRKSKVGQTLGHVSTPFHVHWGFFMLIYVHGVPPVHGRLIHINGFTSPLKELTYSAILIWFSTSFRSNSSVNCSTSQPSDHFLLVWLSLDSG